MTIPNASSTADLMKHLGDSSRILSTYWPPHDANNADKLVTGFLKAYRAHYERIIKALAELRFMEIEVIWRQFWQAQGGGTQGKLFIQSMQGCNRIESNRIPSLTPSRLSRRGAAKGLDQVIEFVGGRDRADRLQHVQCSHHTSLSARPAQVDTAGVDPADSQLCKMHLQVDAQRTRWLRW